MCNIAGYVGTKRAAPILLDMIRRQEGYAGGYYTGIATIHEGKIYYAKLTGDTDRLVANTNAQDLPGTIGIVHSRSKSGGGDSWAHPFVVERGGEVKLAYVANGGAGIFIDRMQDGVAVSEQLLGEGYPFTSVCEYIENKNYPRLSNGKSVHMSDTMCQLIMKNIDQGLSTVEASAKAYCDMPGDVVGLLLSLENPDAITWTRISRPMVVSFTSHGAYLATSPLALPADAGEPTALLANAAGAVTRDGYTTVPYKNPPTEIPAITFTHRERAREIIVNMLKEGETAFGAVARAVKPIFGDCCAPYTLLTYQTLFELHNEGLLKVATKRVEGAAEGIDAPKVYLSL